MKCRDFMNSLLTDLILPELRSWPKFLFEIHLQIAISLSIIEEFQQMRAQNLNWIK